MSKARYTFALAGNQNSGKTTLFNVLTGSNQHVGNWPGVTVEQKTAPMGDPLEIHLRGYALTLRKDDAAKITLRTGKGEQA